jgi:DNA-binding CsgD family transcriptional regulator
MDVVGRADTVRVLSGLADRVRRGHGGVVHVTGEAGAGKTTMLAVARECLAGVPVRGCASDPYDANRGRATATRLLPELPAGYDLVGLVIGCLERLAMAGPLALLVDDVHWSDPDSLDALGAVARRAADMGILVVTSARPTGRGGPYESAVDRFGVRLDLAPLTAAETATLTVRRCGAEPGPALRAFLDETAGNPFLVTELLDALTDRGDIRVEAGVAELVVAASVPDRLAERLVRRTITIGGDDGMVARAVAVLATSCQADELAAILERPLSRVVDAILALVTGGVLVDGGDRLAFRHDLIRRAVHTATPPVVVRALNRRALTVLGPDGADHRVGSCLLAAADPTRRADTARLLAVGGRLAAPNPLIAVELLRAGLAAVDNRDPRSLPAACDLAAALVDTGRPGEALAVLDARLDGVPPPHPVGVHRLRALALSMTGNPRAALAPYQDRTVDQLADGYDLAAPDSADALAELAVLACAAGQPVQAGQLLAWLDGHPAGRSRYGIAHEHSARAWVHAIAGRFQDAVAQSRLGVDALAGDGSPAAAKARPTLVRAIMLDNCGRGDEALGVLRAAQLSGGPRWNHVLAQFATTILLYRHGDWDDALAEIEAGLLAAEETSFGMAVCWPYAIATAIAAQRGDEGGARRHLDAAATRVPPGSLGAELMAYAAALVEEAAGRPDAAAAILATTARTVLAVKAPGLLVNFGTDTVRLNATRDTEVATLVTAAFEGLAGPSGSPIVAAFAGWCRGLLDGDAARVARAATDLAGLDRRPQSAWAGHDAAVLAARSGDQDTARALAAQAFLGYDELGAEQPHRRLRADLREAGVSMRPRRSPPRPTTGWASLTATEATVVELVAAGLTNTAIAERLFVSRRTVESHLARVYPKLGLHRRTELVSAMRHDRDQRRAPAPDPIA